MKLTAYDPGDGAIEFTWQRENGTAADQPSLEIIKKIYRQTFDGERKLRDGWRFVRIDDEVRLVAPIKRIDDRTLQFGELLVTYFVTGAPPWKAGEPLPDDRLTIRGSVRTLTDTPVRNKATRAAIRFFLRHEKELSQQNPETS